MVQILYVSDGFFHPPRKARKHVLDVITAVSDYQVTQAKNLNTLLKLDMSQFQVIVLYIHHKHIHQEALNALKQFVENGGGLLAIHSATASFKQEQRYFEIVGGRFTGHGPVESIDIRPTDEDGEIFGGIGPFAVKDELYLHDLQPDIRTHFETTYQGKPTPMVWTRNFGNGRVCYICPGHRAETMQQSEIQEILRRGLAWVVQ